MKMRTTEVRSNNGVTFIKNHVSMEDRLIFEKSGIQIDYEGDDRSTKVAIHGGKTYVRSEDNTEYPSLFLLADHLHKDVLNTICQPVSHTFRTASDSKPDTIDQMAGVLLHYSAGADYGFSPDERDLKIWHMKQAVYKHLRSILYESTTVDDESGTFTPPIVRAGVLKFSGYSNEFPDNFYQKTEAFIVLAQAVKMSSILDQLQNQCRDRTGPLKQVDDFMLDNYFAGCEIQKNDP